ncbi:cytochrome c oxidase assembly protein [Nocardia sp. CDC160]|uniref:cytochrome c oxidase assembly protein n=1 Tax=Nocardia sp. CDC160 TaxID=3112166 RepID=UPI002DBB57B4|nr:cytochrome c oxidase assembly protein [Nocardia sp. CDC160]MEC3914691.1 cytochrome c oxidase assembly protein [Nocardia sp. CDC160]
MTGTTIAENTERTNAAHDSRVRRSPVPRWAPWSAAVAAAGLVVAVTMAVGDRAYLDQGIPYPGDGAAVTYALLRLIACLAGGFTLGPLVYALFCAVPGKQGRMDVDGYAAVRIAERAAAVWAVSAVALVPVTAADAAGMSLGTAIRLRALPPLIEAAEKPKAWIVVAVLAIAVAVLLRLVLSWNSLFGLAGMSAVAVIAPAVVGNAGEGPNHDYATGAVIPFTIALSMLAGLTWCLVGQQSRLGNAESVQRFALALRRYRIIVASCVAVMVPTAALLAAILAPPSTFVGVYGWLGVAAAVLLAAHAGLAWWLRHPVGRIETSGDRIDRPTRAESRTLSGVLAATTAAGIVWLGISVSTAIQPAPAFANRSFTALQVFLGFDLPHPPDLWRLITVWRFDVVLGSAALLLALAYLMGARRLRQRGDAWPRWRTLSWTLGCVGLLLVTSSGIGAYGYGMFSVHMMTHMALNMFIPVLLVLGAPVTLLLRAIAPAGRGAAPGPREWVLSLMHSRFTRLLSNPVIALVIFVVSLYGLYFSPLFDQLIRFHWGHLLMNIHFLITGYLYYWAIIGIDPGPKRLPHLGRLGMLFAIMPFHAFFGVAVMSMDTLIGADFYPQLQLDWMRDLLGDQHLGGTLAWISGEVPVLLVVGALLSQWAKSERKQAARIDRHQEEYPEDDELAAYNAMLTQLGARRR